MSRILCVIGCLVTVMAEAVPASEKRTSPVNEPAGSTAAVFRAGAAMVDITPIAFPVRVNGMVEERTATSAHDVLMSRALVLDDGRERLAIVVVDSLMLTRAMLDDVKDQARQLSGIPSSRMLIAATHTHSAPSAMPCLGSRTDPDYVPFLTGQIVRSIVLANERLVPARAGWTVTTDDQHNHCRRWIFRSDRMVMTDPFGAHTVRAHMHPGHQSPNHIGPSGPADTDLTLLSVQTLDGKPLAVLGNYAMHYFGTPLVSGDFCGRFGRAFADLAGIDSQSSGFVGMMSQGTSGDSMWPDYSQPATGMNVDTYTRAVAETAAAAWSSITYRSDITLAMAEEILPLNRRVPDAERLAWANELVAQVGDRLPRGWSEVYAFEQLRLHEDPAAELRLQAIRIGDFGITAIPDEVFGITGIKLKNQSPLQPLMNIELANGAEGYIPPPEQHRLGGYTTWPARTAGLEVSAEPKIVETLVGLLERVSGQPRRAVADDLHAYARQVIASKPRAFWRLGEIQGEYQGQPTVNPSAAEVPRNLLVTSDRQIGVAQDCVGPFNGVCEAGIAFYLPGPRGSGLEQNPRGNRSMQFAGGRVVADVPGLNTTYSVECWVWNGFPNSDRAVTGYFFSRGVSGDTGVNGDHLGIGGNFQSAGWDGKLILFNGNERDDVLVGKTVLTPRTWNHVVMTREGRRARVWLNGSNTPEVDAELEPAFLPESGQIFLGGRSDEMFGLEGRLDEFALYDRVLTPEEIRNHFDAAGASLMPQITEAVARPDSQALSPEESMKRTHVREGYELQLVAAEPLVADPVAVDWGADGRLWVAEMADYPSGMDNNGKPGGRIRVLEDRDHDGQFETSTVFLQDVAFPTGVMAWGRGVLVTAAPELFYAEDADGDGVADVRRVLYSGFLEGNQQLRVNGLRWGLDNWVHCASGSHHPGYGADSRIHSHIRNQDVSVGSRDFRIRPDEGALDPQSGPSQFGRNRDAWGHWFGEQNSYPLWHYVLEDHFIRRNPHFAPPDPRHLLTGSNPQVFAAAAPEKRFHSFDQAGRFTSACSGMIYTDDILFEADEGTTASLGPQHVFTCEPFSNLVQHNLLIDDGLTFRLERDPAERESLRDFFASEDRWCRPVMVRTGPDGALWVVDMYRYMIEHPHWLPKEGQDELRPFFRSGDDKGRIYRIVKREVNPQPHTSNGARLRSPADFRMNQLTPAQLVAELESASGWRRDTAQQLLIRAAGPEVDEALKKLVRDGQRATARLQALCTLDGRGTLSAELVLQALKDPHPAVRRHAVRLSSKAQVDLAALEGFENDPHLKVRLELASVAGDWSAPETGPLAGRMLGTVLVSSLRNPDASQRRFLQAAAVSSLTSQNVVMAAEQVVSVAWDPTQPEVVAAGQVHKEFTRSQEFDLLAKLVFEQAGALATPQELPRVLSLVTRTEPGTNHSGESLTAWQMAGLSGLLSRLVVRGIPLDEVATGDIRAQLEAALANSRAVAMDPAADERLRISAIPLLLQSPTAAIDFSRVTELLTPQTSINVQSVVIQQLGRQSGPEIAELLLSGWSSHSPAIRRQILEVLAARQEWTEQLLSQLERKSLAVAEVDLAMRQRLLTTRNQALRERLERLFADTSSADRKQSVERYAAALKLKGDVVQGGTLFGKKCAACHRQNGVGFEVGPNLASLTNRTPESLLTAILDPGAAVEAKYLSFVAATSSGRSVVGLLMTETGSSITLVGPEAKAESLLRSEIEELRSTGKSLMPDGLEKELSHQDLADIIEFVRNLKQ